MLGAAAPPEVSTVSNLSKVSPISIYVITLITFPPVLGKRMITFPSAMITMITLAPARSRWPQTTCASGRCP
jgi:hypothetical protein